MNHAVEPARRRTERTRARRLAPRLPLLLALALAACGAGHGAGPATEATAEPASARSAVPPAARDVARAAVCEGLARLTVTPAAVEVAIDGRPAGEGRRGGDAASAPRLVPRRAGVVDLDAVRSALSAHALDPEAPCARVAEIDALGAVIYQDLVVAMDAAYSSGRDDVGVAATRTAMFRDAVVPRRNLTLESLSRQPYDPTRAPIVLFSTDSIRLRIRAPERAADLVIDARPPLGDDAALVALHEALRDERVAEDAEQPVVVLQADHATPAEVVTATVSAARAAGYQHVLFAVRRGR